MHRSIAKGAVLALLASLVACQQNVPPPAAHAKSYVFKSNEDFDPNFSTQIADTIKMMTPVFAQFYEMGQKDRAAGLTRIQALARAEGFKDDPAFTDMTTQQNYVNQTVTATLSKKQQRLLINESMGAYLDGFDGK